MAQYTRIFGTGNKLPCLPPEMRRAGITEVNTLWLLNKNDPSGIYLHSSQDEWLRIFDRVSGSTSQIRDRSWPENGTLTQIDIDSILVNSKNSNNKDETLHPIVLVDLNEITEQHRRDNIVAELDFLQGQTKRYLKDNLFVLVPQDGCDLSAHRHSLYDLGYIIKETQFPFTVIKPPLENVPAYVINTKHPRINVVWPCDSLTKYAQQIYNTIEIPLQLRDKLFEFNDTTIILHINDYAVDTDTKHEESSLHIYTYTRYKNINSSKSGLGRKYTVDRHLYTAYSIDYMHEILQQKTGFLAFVDDQQQKLPIWTTNSFDKIIFAEHNYNTSGLSVVCGDIITNALKFSIEKAYNSHQDRLKTLNEKDKTKLVSMLVERTIASQTLTSVYIENLESRLNTFRPTYLELIEQLALFQKQKEQPDKTLLAKKIIDDLDALTQLDKIKAVKFDLPKSIISVETTELQFTDSYGKKRRIGEMRIELLLKQDNYSLVDFVKATNMTNLYAANSGKQHPHAYSTGRPCLGLAEPGLIDLWANQEFLYFFQLFIAYLEEINLLDTYGAKANESFDLWPLAGQPFTEV